MKRLNLKVIQSTRNPNMVSIRTEDDSAFIQYYLTKAGFEPGDEVVLVKRSELEAKGLTRRYLDLILGKED